MGAATPAKGCARLFVFRAANMEPQGLQITWAIIGGAVMNALALAKCYYGLKADNASLASKFSEAIVQERSDRRSEHSTLKEHVQHLCSQMDSAIRELSRRVGALESGQDEWTKSLRARTHELADQLHGVALKVDRLERPGKYGHKDD